MLSSAYNMSYTFLIWWAIAWSIVFHLTVFQKPYQSCKKIVFAVPYCQFCCSSCSAMVNDSTWKFSNHIHNHENSPSITNLLEARGWSWVQIVLQCQCGGQAWCGCFLVKPVGSQELSKALLSPKQHMYVRYYRQNFKNLQKTSCKVCSIVWKKFMCSGKSKVLLTRDISPKT